MTIEPIQSTIQNLARQIRSSINLDDLEATDPLLTVGQASLKLLPHRPAAVRDLAYKKLHVHPFKDVPTCWRRAYEESCLWELILELERNFSNADGEDPGSGERNVARWIDDAVALCDRAIIFAGAPRRRDLIDEILRRIEILLKSSEQIGAFKSAFNNTTDCGGADVAPPRPSKRPRLSGENNVKERVTASRVNPQIALITPTTLPPKFPISTYAAIPKLDQSHSITRLDRPSLDQFERHMHKPVTTPLIIANAITYWPACERWKEPRYWHRRTLGGRRLVPVELGSSYTDAGWGQKIMRFGDFMTTHLLRSKTNGEKATTSQTGYLAQHDLLSQIPALRNDIAVPDYCYADTPEAAAAAATSVAEVESAEEEPETVSTAEPLLNIWLGPADTVSPAHTDPHHNILAQVFGRKYVRLFAPSEAENMYPMNGNADCDEEGEGEVERDDRGKEGGASSGVDMGNTSRVDVGLYVSFHDTETPSGNAEGAVSDLEDEDMQQQRRLRKQRFPKHECAAFLEAILEPGDCLYIPRGWWHYVRSLEPSCNVSFWWD